jgi:hypothetical protein
MPLQRPVRLSARVSVHGRQNPYNEHKTDDLAAASRLEVEIVDGGNTTNCHVRRTLGAIGQSVRHLDCVLRVVNLGI